MHDVLKQIIHVHGWGIFGETFVSGHTHMETNKSSCHPWGNTRVAENTECHWNKLTHGSWSVERGACINLCWFLVTEPTSTTTNTHAQVDEQDTCVRDTRSTRWWSSPLVCEHMAAIGGGGSVCFTVISRQPLHVSLNSSSCLILTKNKRPIKGWSWRLSFLEYDLWPGPQLSGVSPMAATLKIVVGSILCNSPKGSCPPFKQGSGGTGSQCYKHGATWILHLHPPPLTAPGKIQNNTEELLLSFNDVSIRAWRLFCWGPYCHIRSSTYNYQLENVIFKNKIKHVFYMVNCIIIIM